MAKPTKHSDFATRTHDALHAVVAPYHERLHAISRVEQRCRLQRAILKASAASEVSQSSRELGISADAVGHLTALCW